MGNRGAGRSPHPTGMGQAGISLIEVSVASAVMMVIALGIASLMTRQSKQIKDLRHYSTRDALKAQLDQEIKKSWSVLLSVGGVSGFAGSGTSRQALPVAKTEATRLSAGNARLYECIWGSSAGGCSATALSGFNPNPIFLVPTTSSTVEKAQAIGGTDTEAAYFDDTGRRCSAAEAGANGNVRCPIQVKTFFQAACANGGVSCQGDRAHQINLRYEIAPAPGVPRGDAPLLRSLSGSSSHLVSDVLTEPAGSASTPSGTPSPEPKVCPPGTLETYRNPSTQDPTCVALSAVCGPSQVLTANSDRTLGCVSPLRTNAELPVDSASSATDPGHCKKGNVVIGINPDGTVRCKDPTPICTVIGQENEAVYQDLTSNTDFMSRTLTCPNGRILTRYWYSAMGSFQDGSCRPSRMGIPRARFSNSTPTGMTIELNMEGSSRGGNKWCVTIRGLCCNFNEAP